MRYFVWNFKGNLSNSTQNILSIHWKIRFLYNIEILRALGFKSSWVFLKRPPVLSVDCVKVPAMIDEQLSFSRHVSSLHNKLARQPRALPCISQCIWMKFHQPFLQTEIRKIILNIGMDKKLPTHKTWVNNYLSMPLNVLGKLNILVNIFQMK